MDSTGINFGEHTMGAAREHLDSVNESYLQHLQHATGFGLSLIFAGFACLLHGLVPSLCSTTGSRAICRLHDKMVVNRIKDPANCTEQ